VKKPWARVTLFVLSVLITALSCDISSAFAVFVLHVMFVDGILRLIALFFRKITFPPTVKKLFGSGLCAVLIAGAVLFAGCINFFSVRPTEYEILTEKELRAEGYRVVLIADVHYGVSLDRAELQRVCDEIEACNPDFIILGGDITDHETGKAKAREVFALLSSIESKYGTYFTFGNHDVPMRGMPSEFADQYGEEELNALVENCGITVLKDDIHYVGEADELALIGRKDRSAGNRLGVQALDASTRDDAFRLVIDHQPNEYQENGNCGTDLLLSGHTHGGQFFPLNFIMPLFNDAVYGRTVIDEDTEAIVSSGLACWGYPFKTAAPAEYLVIDILPAK
jgi:predicted MPP superfamily phosphohydrolase